MYLADDMRILVKAALDIQKSKDAIDAQIKDISKQASKLELGVTVDTKSAKAALDAHNKEIQKALDAQVSKQQALIKQISTIQASLSKNLSFDGIAKGSSAGVTALRSELLALQKEYANLGKELSIGQGSAAPRALDDLNRIGQAIDALKPRFASAAQQAKFFDDTLGNSQKRSTFLLDVDKAQTKLAALGKQLGVLGANPALAAEFNRLTALGQNLQTKTDLTNFNKQVQLLDSNMKQAAASTQLLGEKGRSTGAVFAQFFGTAIITSLFVQSIREAVNELKSIDTILTEIEKTGNYAGHALEEVGRSSFEIANRYGEKASGYLSGVLEMSRAGFTGQLGQQLAELSVLTQSAGFMNAELANEYLLATNFAYDYNGSVEKLNSALDMQTQVANRNALNLSHLAQATKIAASIAAQAGVPIEEMTAAIGTMIVVTQQGGEVAGRAFRSILMNLQQVAGETEDGEILDESKFKKVQATLHDVGVEMGYMRDGILRLRDPMDILKELAAVYNSMDKDDARRAAIINDLGGKYRGNQLAALLSSWSQYEKLLADTENASGTALRAAELSAQSWEGMLNTLSNKWTAFVQNFIDSDLAKLFLGMAGDILTLADSLAALVDVTGLLPPIIAGILAYKLIQQVAKLATGLKTLAMNTSTVGKWLGLLSTSYKNLTIEQQAAKLAEAGFTQQEAQKILVLNGATAAQANAATGNYQYAASSTAAAGSTFSFKSALDALKATIMANPIGFLVTAITVLISAVTLANNALEQQRQELESLARESKERAASLRDEQSELSELIKRFKELKEAEKPDDETRAEIRDIQAEITKLVGDQAAQLDLVNGKLDDELAKLQAISLEQAKQARDAAVVARTRAQNAAESASGDQSYIFSGWDYASKRDQDAEAIFKEKGLPYQTGGFFDDTLFIASGGIGDTDAQARLENLQAMIDALKESATYNWAESDLFSTLYEAAERYKAYLADVKSAEDDVVASSVMIAHLEQIAKGAATDTPEAFAAYRQAVIDAAMADDAHTASLEQVTQAVDALIQSDLPEWMQEVAAAQEELPADFATLTSELKDLQAAYETLIQAQEEYNDTGAITAKTYKDLAENNLLQYLSEKEGKLVVNTAALEDEAEATKKAAEQALYLAASADIQNLALGEVDSLSAVAKSAIEQFGAKADTVSGQVSNLAGESVTLASSLALVAEAASGQAIDLTDFKKKSEAIISAYAGIADSIGSISIRSASDSKLAKKNKKKSSKSKSSKKAKDTHLEAYETAAKELKYLREMDIIDEAEYFKRLEALAREYLAGRGKYLDEYRSVQVEIHKWRKKELEDQHKDALKAAKDEYEARKKTAEASFKAEKKILDARKKALQDELSAYKSIIDARKKALQREGEAHDIDKDVAERNRSIADLQARIETLSLDDSAKTKAERLELEKRLRDELTELEEKQYDRSIDLQTQALDDEADRFSQYIDGQVDQIDNMLFHLQNAHDWLLESLSASQDAFVVSINAKFDALVASAQQAANAISSAFINAGSVRDLQTQLVTQGFQLPKFGVDGKLGKETVRAWQTYLNSLGAKLKVDGVRGPATKAAEKQYGLSFPTYHSGGVVGGAQPEEFKRLFDLKPDEIIAKVQKGEVVLNESQQERITVALKHAINGDQLRLFQAMGRLKENPVIPEALLNRIPMQTPAATALPSITLEQHIQLGSTDDDSMRKLEDWGNRLIEQAVDRVYGAQIKHAKWGAGLPVRSY